MVGANLWSGGLSCSYAVGRSVPTRLTLQCQVLFSKGGLRGLWIKSYFFLLNWWFLYSGQILDLSCIEHEVGLKQIMWENVFSLFVLLYAHFWSWIYGEEPMYVYVGIFVNFTCEWLLEHCWVKLKMLWIDWLILLAYFLVCFVVFYKSYNFWLWIFGHFYF